MFNKKNATQKNWRMVKKGKNILFSCSLVLTSGVGALATQSSSAALAKDTAKVDTVSAETSTKSLSSEKKVENVGEGSRSIKSGESNGTTHTGNNAGGVNYLLNGQVTPAPTVNTTYSNTSINIKIATVASTDRELTGTGKPGATINVKIKGHVVYNAKVDNSGKWVVKLTQGLNNNAGDGATLTDKDGITVTQTLNGVESTEVNVFVSIGHSNVEASSLSADSKSLIAGQKEVTVKVPHDVGMGYFQYKNDANVDSQLGFKRDSLNSPWVSVDESKGKVKSYSSDGFYDTVVLEMKQKIKEGTNGASSTSNAVENGYSSLDGWKKINVVKEAPTITSKVTGNKKEVVKGTSLDLMSLITVADKEDNANATIGTPVHAEVVSVNGDVNTKTVDTNKLGSYSVVYKAIDSQGKASTVTITVEVKKTPTPPVPQVAANDDGSVEITPQGDTDKVEIKYTDENNQPRTITVKKGSDNKWKVEGTTPTGVTVDEATGKVTLPKEAVKDNSQVTADATKGDSDKATQTETAKSNKETIVPELQIPYDNPTLKEIYVYATEETNITLKATDNSGKLVQFGLKLPVSGSWDDQMNGNSQYALYLKADKITTETTATVANPASITVTGKVPKGKYTAGTGFTRFLYAKDEAGNETTKTYENKPSVNGYIRFIVKEQTSKYDAKAPATPILVTEPTADITKIEEAVKNANSTFKDKIGSVTLSVDGSKVIVTYNDGSTDELDAQKVFVVKQKTPLAPKVEAKDNGVVEVTPQGDADKTEVKYTDENGASQTVIVKKGADGKWKAEGTTPAGVTVDETTGKVTLSANVVKDNTEVSATATNGNSDPSEVAKAQAKKPVEAPKEVKIKEFKHGDTSVTITPEDKPDLIFLGVKGKEAKLEKQADGKYKVVSNQANVTVEEQADGSIKLTLPTGETFAAGDRVVTRAENKDNTMPKGTRPSQEVSGYAGLNPITTKVPVKNPSSLTDEEKAKVKEEVKKANPGIEEADIEVEANGDVTYNHKGAGSDAKQPLKLTNTVKPADANNVKDPETKTPVKDASNLTDEEKAKVEEAVKKANPTATKVEVGQDGTTTVTFPDGSTTTITPDKTVKSADANNVKDPEVTPVKDPSNLTDEEKVKVEEAVKKANPTATKVEVGQDGTTTVTFPDGSTATITPDKTIKSADANGVKDPETKTPVKDPSNLTDEEKAKVKDEVKKANPTATKVEVGQDGTTTVTFPDGSTATITPDKTIKSADANGVKDPEAKTPVKDPSNLTDEEKAKVEEAVKKANPTATKVEVGKDGTTTVTFPDGSTATITPDKTVKSADANGVKDPEAKTPVKDASNLTDEEKAKVEEAVKKANPTATKVEVGQDGTTTVTFPDGSTTTITPDKTVKSADANNVKDPEVTPVKDPSNLTDEEKVKVEEAVKKANPTATKVEVGQDGTTTVTFPDGSTATITPDKTIKSADANGVKDPEAKTPVKDPSNLTDEEKVKVEEAVKKANPTATKVEVGQDGTTTVTFPDGSTATITPDKTIKSADANGVKDPEVTPVKDPSNLTDEEKAKVEEAVKKANPTATKK
ncbi:Ig-like domain-containing protein [Gemella sp. ND 6198]|uniref:Ig-like domain-containing protein n=1 Tax=Gemella sp. ND 6198 TaxID=2040624 RepID=UPI0013B37CFF|nr:Ig-like domain-containing protein [Gemella sp. ND 6198]